MTRLDLLRLHFWRQTTFFFLVWDFFFCGSERVENANRWCLVHTRQQLFPLAGRQSRVPFIFFILLFRFVVLFCFVVFDLRLARAVTA